MNEHDDLTARLRDLGRNPVEPATASRHLTAMAAGRQVRIGRFGRAKVAAAFAAGIILGGTGLASAGVMGNGAQNTVANAAEHVGVNLPGGKPRSTTGCTVARSGETLTQTTFKNHGDYVSAGGDPKADCGKPVKATDNQPDKSKGDEHRSECAPPWAGKMPKATRTSIKDANPNWTPPAGCESDEAPTTPGAPAADERSTTGTAHAENDQDHGKPATSDAQGKSAEHRPETSGSVSTAETPEDGKGNGNGGAPDDTPAG